MNLRPAAQLRARRAVRARDRRGCSVRARLVFQVHDEDNAETAARFSKWDAAGEFLGQAQIGSNDEDSPLDDTFVVDRDGFLYFYTATESGSSSNELRLWKCTTEWPSADTTRAVFASSATSLKRLCAGKRARREVLEPRANR